MPNGLHFPDHENPISLKNVKQSNCGRSSFLESPAQRTTTLDL